MSNQRINNGWNTRFIGDNTSAKIIQFTKRFLETIMVFTVVEVLLDCDGED